MVGCLAWQRVGPWTLKIAGGSNAVEPRGEAEGVGCAISIVQFMVA